MDKDYYFMKSGIPPPQPMLWTNSTIDDAFPHFNSSWTTATATATAADVFDLRHLDQINLPNLAPPLPTISADPGFAERAAKFSCFGSRSFNGRTPPPPAAAPELNPARLPRVASSPVLRQNGSPPPRYQSSPLEMRWTSGANSNEESSVSEKIPGGETAPKTSNDIISRKRKPKSRATGGEGDDDRNSKRSKQTEKVENEEEEENDKNQKPPEPPLKDYIHVRARRGQATDSHSLAERVRREKISERMKLLQDLVPGCNKVTGKALMLDEIINYVQSLQRQVEFLSMKLSSVNPSLDFNMETLLSKDQSTTLPQQIYPLDSSAPAFYHHQNVQQQQLHGTTISSAQCSADPLPLDADLVTVDGFSQNLPQFPSFTEDDLHSIVQMGFLQNSVNFPVRNQASDMKIEL